jgi:hypothetical protein
MAKPKLYNVAKRYLEIIDQMELTADRKEFLLRTGNT